jgi:hypothetical protein
MVGDSLCLDFGLDMGNDDALRAVVEHSRDEPVLLARDSHRLA